MKWASILVAVVMFLLLSVWLVGYFLPQSHAVERSVWLSRTPQEVFEFVSHVEQHPNWRRGIQKVVLQEGKDGLIVSETGEQGTLRYVIERVEPPSLMTTRIIDESDFGGTWAITLREERGGTRVRVREEGEVYSPLFRFFSTFVFGHERTVEAYLTSLASHLGSPAELETP